MRTKSFNSIKTKGFVNVKKVAELVKGEDK